MKILVTGAYGQLGSELKVLSERVSNHQFIFTDIDSLDITDENQVAHFFAAQQPGFVLNCAAYTAVDKAETDSKAARKINTDAPGFLAKAAARSKSGLIHISTDYVFDGNNFKPYSEEDMVNPAGVYGKTKYEGELRCFDENRKSVIIRTSWLYSSFGNNFVKTMLRLGIERDFLKVVFDQLGSPTYAADLAGAILSILEVFENSKDNFKSGIYHFSNEGVASWYDFAKSIFEISGLNCKVLPVLSDEFPTPAKRPPYSVLNKSKIKTTFNFEIPYWKDSLRICIEKIKKQNKWKTKNF